MESKIEKLRNSMEYHERMANERFEQIKAIEDKERLIGFRNKNDGRMSTDGVQLVISNRTTIER